MKRFTALLITAVLLISAIGAVTVFAGVDSVTISGSSSIQAGKTYEYTVTVKATGYNFSCDVSSSGVFNVKHVDCDDGRSDDNGSLSKTVKISVTVASDAKSGDKGYIKVKGQGCYIDVDTGNPKDPFNISKTLEASVSSPSSPTPRPTAKTSTTRTVKATAAPTEWEIASANVETMQSGGSVTIDIAKDPDIPVSVLSSIKEKKGVLNVNFGSYTCTIDGKTLGSLPESSKSIDLSMNMGKDKAFSSAVGGSDAYQLHFAYHGQLPGKFAYTFKAENSKPGDALYLYYYYDQSGIIEGVQSAVVDSNGYVSFEIYHCSSYFVSSGIIDGAAGVDFTSAPLPEQTLQEALDKQAELEIQLADALNTAEELQTQIDTLKSETAPVNPLTSDVSGSVDRLFGVPYSSLIAALIGAALFAMFITMLVCRVGVFRKKEAARERYDKMF